MQAVQIRLAEAALRDLQELQVLQFFLVGADAALTGAHILGQLLLAGKATAIVPSVFQKHGVEQLGADTEVGVGEEEIRHLCESMQRNGIGTDDLDVASDIIQLTGDVVHA